MKKPYLTNLQRAYFSFLLNTSLLLLRVVIICLLYVATIMLLNVIIQSIGLHQGIWSELFNPKEPFLPATLFLFCAAVVPIKPAADKPKRLTQKERSQFTLSDSQKSILVGLALGDLHIPKQKGAVNACLRFEQGSVHEDYINFLYKLFSSYCAMVPRTRSHAPDKRTGKVYSSIYFSTYSLPCFNELYDLFYSGGKKVVPLNIAELLTPIGLGYLICEDGTLRQTAPTCYNLYRIL